MMGLDPKVYIPVIAALVGAFIGGLIKEIGTAYQAYREDKRVLKRVLYNQLELWLQFKLCDPGPYVLTAVQKLNELISKSGIPEELVKEMTEPIQRELNSIYGEIELGNPVKLKERYQNVVDDLSRIDPLLAYNISGRIDVESIMSKMNTFFDAADSRIAQSEATPPAPELKLFMVCQMQEKLLKEVVSSVKSDIYRTAWRISALTLIRTWFMLRKAASNQDKKRSAELEKMMQEALSLAASMQQGNDAHSSSKAPLPQ